MTRAPGKPRKPKRRVKMSRWEHELTTAHKKAAKPKPPKPQVKFKFRTFDSASGPVVPASVPSGWIKIADLPTDKFRVVQINSYGVPVKWEVYANPRAT